MENENIVTENNENVAVQVDNQPPKKDNKKLIIIGIIALVVIGVIVYLVFTSNKEEESQTNTSTEQEQEDKKDKTKEEEKQEEDQTEDQTEEQTEEQTEDDNEQVDDEDDDDYVLIPGDEKRKVTHDDNSSKYSKTVQELFNFFREDTSDNTIVSYFPETFEYEYRIFLVLRNIDSKYRGSIKCKDLDVVFVGNGKDEFHAACGTWALFHGSDYFGMDGKKMRYPTQKEAKALIIKHDKEDPDDIYVADTINATAFANLYNQYFGKDSFKKEDFSRSFIYYYYDSKRDLFEGFESGSGEEASGSYDKQKIIKVDENEKSLVIYTEAINENDSKKYSLNYNFVKEDSTGNWIFKSREVK